MNACAPAIYNVVVRLIGLNHACDEHVERSNRRSMLDETRLSSLVVVGRMPAVTERRQVDEIVKPSEKLKQVYQLWCKEEGRFGTRSQVSCVGTLHL